MYYLGLDAGTSSLKCMILDESKTIVHDASYHYSYQQPKKEYKEIDPMVLFEGVKRAFSNIPVSIQRKEIQSICVTGQMHTTIFLDEHGASIRPAIMWNDTRTKTMVTPLKKELSKQTETKYIAKTISTGCLATSLLWLKEYERTNFDRIYKVCSVKDYLSYLLCGAFKTDYCDASTSSMYDIQSKTYSKYMLNKVGIKESLLCGVVASGTTLGLLDSHVANKFGFHESTSVLMGTGDNPASAIANGLLDSPQPIFSLGTSGVAIQCKQDLDFDGKGKNVLFSMDKLHIYNIVQGALQSAGGTHLWWIQNILNSKDYSLDQDNIEASDLGNNSLLFFPYLNGDKTVYADPLIKGAFIGLSLSTTRQDMLQSILEGIAFGSKLLLESMVSNQEYSQLIVNGGGTRSSIWMQIFANVLNKEVVVLNDQASPCFGACLIAWHQTHQKTTNKGLSKPRKQYQPTPDIAALYDKQYGRYKKIYGLLKQLEEEDTNISERQM